MRAKKKAIRYGDSILPLIKTESGNFALLNGRNAFWIAEVLGSIKTEQSRAILNDLYSRSNRTARLTGATGLAQQGALPDKVDEQNFLVHAVRSESIDTELELAVIALRRSKDPAALPCLLDALRKEGGGYWKHAYACQAVVRIGSKEAVPVLEDCLRSPVYYALPDAFRALIALGDTNAVPLAIARVSPAEEQYNSGYVVKELQKVTHKRYGFDSAVWEKWWESTKTTWQIPDEFLKPWDEQKRVY
jgi:hypothetical protein